MPAFIDLTGKRFGRLLVLRRGPDAKHRIPRWHCLCDCGNETLSWGQALRDGYAQSCGCLCREVNGARIKAQSTTHGRSKEHIYKVWKTMIRRCHKPGSSGYEKYGAKGIRVCERWHTFENWIADMGEPPTFRHSIDRIDPSSGYEPGNCRWATAREQQNNRRNNTRLTYAGETLTIAQWGARLGIAPQTISARISRYGWTVDRALTTPVH